MTINPMQSAHDAPRCKANSKRTGKRCRAPAVRGCRVCRMHGASGGAPTGKRNGNYRHGTRHKRGDPSSEISQLVVTLGAAILRSHALVNGCQISRDSRFRHFREAGHCQRLEI